MNKCFSACSKNVHVSPQIELFLHVSIFRTYGICVLFIPAWYSYVETEVAKYFEWNSTSPSQEGASWRQVPQIIYFKTKHHFLSSSKQSKHWQRFNKRTGILYSASLWHDWRPWPQLEPEYFFRCTLSLFETKISTNWYLII